ncbi:MAG TPA: rRNA maturation RNase YbeY [Candidatus Limosilactobacillus merdigallinarum]|uniref:Endoribonuclease YbeY n=1 Tax=Candidatus Limosilactobacillus merdigallinarum TaxID=2838652 RepID=A0A9D2ALQ8_9LACO|nr:rRNA maturation RNase YbeY [Candidatus Limosilactobacillus merdigallinarum]
MELEMYDHSNGKLTNHQRDLTEEVLSLAANEINLIPYSSMSVTFVRNPEMREINKKYRGVDRATDVISFAINDNEDIEILAQLMDVDRLDLGDLFVSLDKVDEQALFLNHSTDRELAYLLVHGFLHLNGYDHQTKDEEADMFEVQERILTKYGLPR